MKGVRFVLEKIRDPDTGEILSISPPEEGVFRVVLRAKDYAVHDKPLNDCPNCEGNGYVFKCDDEGHPIVKPCTAKGCDAILILEERDRKLGI